MACLYFSRPKALVVRVSPSIEVVSKARHLFLIDPSERL